MLEEHHQEVESWVKSGEVQGLSFPCPLNACGTARPKARPLLRACSSAWRSELLPSAQPKWLRMAKEISPRKKAQLCQLHCHVLTSTQAWESNTRVLPPLTAPPFLSTGPSTVPRPTIPTPRGRQVRDCPCCLQHPSLLKLDSVLPLVHHFLLPPSQPQLLHEWNVALSTHPKMS